METQATEAHHSEVHEDEDRNPLTGERRRFKQVGLEAVLGYHNQDIIDRYMADHEAEPERAAELFEDAKRWIWLCAEANREFEDGQTDVPPMTIFDEQKELDDMWHTFILFTSAYVEFCFTNFGRYVHHAPTPEREKREFYAKADDDKKVIQGEQSALYRRVASYVFDKLGGDVARRWYLATLN